MPVAVYPKLQSGVLLCIDRNEDVLECEKSFLESFGYTVLTAASGGRGLELASICPIDVVIVDYFMPEMNGHRSRQTIDLSLGSNSGRQRDPRAHDNFEQY